MVKTMVDTYLLDNGLRVLLIPLPQFYSTTIVFYIKAGSRFEKENQIGAAHFLEHLSFTKGKSFNNKLELSRYLDRIGAKSNASTSRELVEYYIKVRSEKDNVLSALNLLKELIHETDFQTDIFEKEKKVIKQELEASLAKPGAAVFRALDELTWPGDRLGQHVIGSLESLEKLDLEQTLRFRKESFLPPRSVLAIGGNFTQQLVSSLVEEWGKTAGAGSSTIMPLSDQTFGHLKWIERKDDDQARFAYYFKGVSINNPRRRAYSLLSAILGRGFGSRLFQAVREKEGLAYSVGSFMGAYSDTGVFGISAEVQEDKLEKTVKVINEEINKIKNEKISEEELQLAKQKVKSGVALSLETPASLLGWFGPQYLLKEKVETYEDFCRQIDDVEIADLQKIAQEIFTEGQLNFAFTANANHSDNLYNLLRIKNVP